MMGLRQPERGASYQENFMECGEFLQNGRSDDRNGSGGEGNTLRKTTEWANR
jgi:hypothetical protein